MIGRAALAILAVAVIMPHEPDLGFGRPGATLNSAAQQACRAVGQGAASCAAPLQNFAGDVPDRMEPLKAAIFAKLAEARRDLARADENSPKILVGDERGAAVAVSASPPSSPQ